MTEAPSYSTVDEAIAACLSEALALEGGGLTISVCQDDCTRSHEERASGPCDHCRRIFVGEAGRA